MHTQTRVRTGPLFLFLSSFFFSTLQLAAPLARLSFYSFRTRALAFTRTHAWSRTHATNDHTTTRVPSVHFSFLFFSSPQPSSRETALVPSGRRAAASRRE